MPTTCILVANGHRARFLQHDCSDGDLVELAGFIYTAASTVKHSAAAHAHGKEGHGPGSTAHAGTQFEAQTTGTDRAYSRFARQLADYLNKAIETRHCDGVALIATASMLGALRPMLSPRAREKLLRSVDSDFTLYQGRELQQRVQEALGLGV
jgi:protein required for attachment to host cells